MNRPVYLFIAMALAFSTCTIEENTTFSSNFSGKTVTRIDMSAMTMFMSMDSTGSAKSQFNKQIQKSLDSAAMTAPSDIKMEMKFDTVNNFMSISYAFKNLDEANQATKKLTEQQGGAAAQSTYRWEKKGKILVMPGLEHLGKMLDAQGGESNPMMKGMTYSMSRTFPKKIAKVSDPRLLLSSDGKTITFKSTIEELGKNPLKEITVTFK